MGNRVGSNPFVRTTQTHLFGCVFLRGADEGRKGSHKLLWVHARSENRIGLVEFVGWRAPTLWRSQNIRPHLFDSVIVKVGSNAKNACVLFKKVIY